MISCSFIGHRDATNEIESTLVLAIINLIENQQVTNFYVGHQGRFDSIVQRVLKKLSLRYPHITYTIVLAYMPSKARQYDNLDYENSIFPDSLEFIAPRYAIIHRNKWMIRQSDYIIAYVTNSTSNAHKFLDIAIRAGKEVINIAK